MGDFVQRLRMNNIFPNTGMVAPEMAPYDPVKEVMPFMQQQRVDDYNEAHNQMPRTPALANIGASMQNLTGPQNNGHPMNVVYQDGMNDFQKAQIDLKNRSLEAETNFNNRKLDTNDQNSDLDRAIKEKRAETYDFKANHPGMKFRAEPGGNVTAYNPLTGEAVDTGISSGKLTDKQRLELQSANTIKQIDERNKGNENLQEMRGNQALQQIGKRVAGQKEVYETRPARTELPTQTKTREGNAARELANTNPELAPFININQDGTFSITPPGNSSYFGAKGPTPEQFNQIKSALYPSSNTGGTGGNDGNTGVPDGRVVVEKDGQQFHLPAGQLDDAIKQGYKKVGG